MNLIPSPDTTTTSAWKVRSGEKGEEKEEIADRKRGRVAFNSKRVEWNARSRMGKKVVRRVWSEAWAKIEPVKSSKKEREKEREGHTLVLLTSAHNVTYNAQ